MTQDRFDVEYKILSRYFKPKQFRLTQNELLFAAQTNSLRVYTIKVDLTNDYPYSVPKVFITNPKPLRDKWGRPLTDASHSMHRFLRILRCILCRQKTDVQEYVITDR